MKLYTIVGGVNGAGKSSLSGVLRAQRSDLGRIIDVDRLVIEHGGDPLAGGRAAVDLIDACIGRGVCFTQETTLSGHRTARTIRRARDAGYTIRLYYVGISSAEECLRRIRNRVAKGGHDIPEADVRRRFEQRIPALLEVLPLCDEAVLFDNENGFVEVGAWRNGELIALRPELPAWFLELQEANAKNALASFNSSKK